MQHNEWCQAVDRAHKSRATKADELNEWVRGYELKACGKAHKGLGPSPYF